MNKNDQELWDLLGRFSLSEDQQHLTFEEIRRGDDFIERHDQVPIDAEVISRATARVRKELDNRRQRQVGLGQPRRIVAIAASLVMALSLAIYCLQDKTQIMQRPDEPSLTAQLDVSDIWMLWLASEDEVDQEIGDTPFTEVLHYFNEANWDVESILDSEIDREPDIPDISGMVWIGHRPC